MKYIKTYEDVETEFKTAQDVLLYYDDSESFDNICEQMVNEGTIDEYDFEYAAKYYFTQNHDILLEYFKEGGEIWGSFFDDIPEEERFDYAGKYIDDNDELNVEKLEQDDIINDADEFVTFLKDKYWNYFDFSNSIDDSYWEEITYALRHNVEDNKLPIYRSIMISKNMKDVDNDTKEYSGVGVYWSHE